MWFALSPPWSRGSPTRASGRFEDWSLWLPRKSRIEPWKALVPRLVTKLIPSPPVWTLMSLPPVFTAIWSKESKSQ